MGGGYSYGGSGGYGHGGGYNHHGGHNKTVPQKYKTMMCRHFENTGTCTLQDRCSFAHGAHELRNINDVKC